MSEWLYWFLVVLGTVVGICFALINLISPYEEENMRSCWYNFTSRTAPSLKQRIHLDHIVGVMDHGTGNGCLIRLDNGNLVEVIDAFDDVCAVISARHQFREDDRLK